MPEQELKRLIQPPLHFRRLFAPGFDCRDFREIGRQIVCGKGLHVHLDQAHEWAAKGRFSFSSPIDKHADCGNPRFAVVNAIYADAAKAKRLSIAIISGSAFKAKLRPDKRSNPSAGPPGYVGGLEIHFATGIAKIDSKGRQRG